MVKAWVMAAVLVLILLLIGGGYYLIIKSSERQEGKIIDNNPVNNSGIANPASVYCKENNGTLEIRSNEQGQYGVCLKDGKECEEWAYFREECIL